VALDKKKCWNGCTPVSYSGGTEFQYRPEKDIVATGLPGSPECFKQHPRTTGTCNTARSLGVFIVADVRNHRNVLQLDSDYNTVIINSGIYISKNPPILRLYLACFEADSLCVSVIFLNR